MSSLRIETVVDHLLAEHRRSKAGQAWDSVFTADYRFEHTLRVAHYGRLIADGEGQDAELCVAACLLHDIAYFESPDVLDNWDDHGRLGARL